MDGRTLRRTWQRPGGRDRAGLRVFAEDRSAAHQAWVTASALAAAAMAVFAVASVASFLRLAGLSFGLSIVSPALAEEVADGASPAPAPVEERRAGQAGDSGQISDADDLARFTIVPDPGRAPGWPQPFTVFAAADGSDTAQGAASAMQLAFAAIGSLATSMTVSYPFGFWCADSWRVLADSDASHLNRICGTANSGGGWTLEPKREGDNPGGPGTLLSCEDGRAVVISEMNAKLSVKNSSEQSWSGGADNTLGGSGYGGSGNSASVQQNTGVNTVAQSSVRVFAIGSF